MDADQLQMYFKGFSEGLRVMRSKTQMTLQTLTERLDALGSVKITGLIFAHSYRGYYSDIAFSLDKKNAQAKNVAKMIRRCIGKTYRGYKGGDFKMDCDTPVWLANYGDIGRKLISINDDGTFVTAEDN